MVALAACTTSAQEHPPAAKAPAPPLREQTIYVPYEKLREVFEKPGRGVFLSYEEFQQLWDAARAARQPAADLKAPTAVVITDSESEATVEKDIVRVKTQLKIDLLREGWHEVPLRLNGAAILSATVNGQPAPITVNAQGEHQLLVQSDSKRPVEIRAEIEYARAYTKAEGRNRVAFASPQAAVNRWKIRIPQPGVEVEVRPLVAATVEEPAAGAAARETRLLAFVGAAPQVEIQWTPKAEGASGLSAMVTTQAEQEVQLETGVTRTQVRLNLSISRSEVAKLSLLVSSGQKVVNVFDANVRKWSVASADGGHQRVNVELFEARRGTQSLVIDLERFGEQQAGEVIIPVVQVVDAPRQQGTVVVRVAAGLRAEPARYTGLSQIDAAELPAAMARQKWDFSYRYAALPFELAFRVEKVQPKLLVDELVEVFVDHEKLSLLHTAVIDVQQAGVFQLQTDVPAGFDVRQVRGVAMAGATAAIVDSHHVGGENNRHLTINLSSRAEGRVGIQVELVRRLDDPNLAGPTGKQSTMPLAIPRVTPASAEQVRGWILVYAPESLQVNLANVNGATRATATDASSVVAAPGNDGFGRGGSPLALAYFKQPVSLSLVAERKRPHVEIAQLLVVRAKPGVVAYEATLNYDVKYSGVKSLRVDVPAALSGQIRNETRDVREQKLDPQPKDVAEKYVAWSLTGPTEFLGKGAIKLVWEQKLDNLQIGKSVPLDVPRLVPRQVDLAMGQIVLVKEESLDVTPTGKPTGLEPIDPQQQLMPGASVPDAASAYQFQDEWSLSIAATRYQPEELKQTSVEEGVVRMVCTRSGSTSVQALYRMRSSKQRLKIQLPDKATFDTEPVRINGRSAAMERGSASEHFVPLSGQTPDKPFLLELRYVVAGTPRQLDLPAFPDEPAVQRVALCVYLPKEQSLLGSQGPWTPAAGELFAANLPNLDQQWIRKLKAGVNVPDSVGGDFPTDGQLYVYSALGPEAPPSGSLHLMTMDRRWLNGWVCGLVLLGGVLLLRRPLVQKVYALAGVAVVLLLAGLFLPVFTTELFRGYLDAALILVLVIWGAWQIGRWLPQSLKTVTATGTPASVSPAAAPPVLTAAPPPVTPPPTPPTADAGQEGRGDV
ncbi:MAG: hypothetical protein K8T25_08080 [Planctomycetia bacterium]|nr:hypothetical protein [Planctomycetia bacterium]